MKLALRLGRTLEELCSTMASAEFSMWVQLYNEEPWDDTRGDLHAGIIASTVANFAGKALKEGAPSLTPQDFMPLLPREEEDPLEHFRKMLKG